MSNSKEPHISLRAKSFLVIRVTSTNIIVHSSIQVTPISKLTALTIMLENITCQILRRVHIVTYKIAHQYKEFAEKTHPLK
jgi:hypothetical protein